MKKKETYNKFDNYEDIEVAFAKVKSGEWNLERFTEWYDQVKNIEYMYATADESM